jgi:hypothetical protein
VVSSPGEKGTDIIPLADNRKVLLWEPVDWSKPQDWKGMREEIKVETAKVLTGSYGQFTTVAFDGIHKIYDVFREAAAEDTKTHDGKTDGRKYFPQAQRDFLAWFSMIWNCKTVPYILFTVWAAIEKDDPLAVEDPKGPPVAKSIWPNFMGQVQRSMVGEVNCIYSFVEGGKAIWQLKQDARIKGIGLKLPPAEAEKLPYKIPADWQVLKKLLMPQEVK